jgi:hypothetical protein
MHYTISEVVPVSDQMSSGVQSETYILFNIHIYLVSMIQIYFKEIYTIHKAILVIVEEM